jgi:hypothetical protein
VGDTRLEMHKHTSTAPISLRTYVGNDNCRK